MALERAAQGKEEQQYGDKVFTSEDAVIDEVVAEVGRDVLKTYFQTGDIPTEPQFVLGTSNGFSSPITGIAVMDFDGDGFDEGDVGGFDHRVAGLDTADVAFGFDHS